MRKLSRRAKNRYMSQLIELSRRHNGYIRATNPAVSEMLGDDRGRAALDVLEALGLISIRRADSGMPYMISLTSAGLTYFDTNADARRESRRETRRYWLTTIIAVAALLKSFSPELRELWAWLSMLSAR